KEDKEKGLNTMLWLEIEQLRWITENKKSDNNQLRPKVGVFSCHWWNYQASFLNGFVKNLT
ncbi:MAG TPA: hypothetical protein DCL81_05075, partial [Algoriphagus sp.]|nr:hypothetical protein [Algoriphagus sp.]